MSSVAKKLHPKSKFSPEEDILLQQLVHVFGENDWVHVAQRMPRRNQRQCKDRWFNYLSPTIQPHPWTPEEDLLLLDRVRGCGPKWVRIAAYFPGRTDIQVKNRHLVLSRRRRKESHAIDCESAAPPVKLAPPFSSPFSCDTIPPLRPRTPQDLARISPLCQDQPSTGASDLARAPYALPSLVTVAFGRGPL
jgi:hypothetical protein